jgi:formylmethanofuran dehydrogenase subunit E
MAEETGGVPASQVPASVVEPLIAKVMGAPDEMLMKIGNVVAHSLPKKVESFAGFVCELCGEMAVEGYGRPLGDKRVCIPCYEQATQGK